MNDKIINIYGQEAWHTNAKIVASKDALVLLKELIDKAIEQGSSKMTQLDSELFASDDEGYNLEIICLSS